MKDNEIYSKTYFHGEYCDTRSTLELKDRYESRGGASNETYPTWIQSCDTAFDILYV